MHADSLRWNQRTSAWIGVHRRFQTLSDACSLVPFINNAWHNGAKMHPAMLRLAISGKRAGGNKEVTRNLWLSLLLLWLSFAARPLHPSQEDDIPSATPAQRSPQILSVLPMGGRPGSVMEVDVRGDFLEGAERVDFGDQDIKAWIKRVSFTRIDMEVDIRSGAEPGPRFFRVITPRGPSNLLLFRVSEWKCVAESEPNDDLQAPQVIDWPVLVSGRLLTPRDVDLFRIGAKAGQRINLNLFAARNWSGADLSLALLDGRGHTLRQDEGRFTWDPYIEFTFPRDGDYLVAVTLTRMPAGGQSSTHLVYQLAIGQLPVLLSVFPICLSAGLPVSLQVRGEFLSPEGIWTLPGASVAVARESSIGEKTSSVSTSGAVTLGLSGRLAPDAPPGIRHLQLKHESGLVAPLALLVGEYPATTEGEKNDDLSSAQPISIPGTVNGRIDHNWDEDMFKFHAGQNDVLVFDVDAERLGSRLDARLTLIDAAGKTLASNDDAKESESGRNWDPKLEYTFKEAGTYFIKLFSQQRRGGADYVYALTARPRVPGFSLSLGAERLSVPRGGKASFTVNVRREDGYQGEISVGIAPLPAGVKANPLLLKGDQSSGKLELRAEPEAQLGVVVGKVEGKGIVDGREICRMASVPAARIVGSGPGFVNYRSTDALVSVVEPALFSLESAASEVFLVRGGSSEFGIKLVRRPRFDAPLEFFLENSPDGVTLEKVEVVDQGHMARLTLRAADSAAVVRVPDLVVIGKVNSGEVRRSEAAPRVSLQVD